MCLKVQNDKKQISYKCSSNRPDNWTGMDDNSNRPDNWTGIDDNSNRPDN